MGAEQDWSLKHFLLYTRTCSTRVPAGLAYSPIPISISGHLGYLVAYYLARSGLLSQKTQKSYGISSVPAMPFTESSLQTITVKILEVTIANMICFGECSYALTVANFPSKTHICCSSIPIVFQQDLAVPCRHQS